MATTCTVMLAILAVVKKSLNIKYSLALVVFLNNVISSYKCSIKIFKNSKVLLLLILSQTKLLILGALL